MDAEIIAKIFFNCRWDARCLLRSQSSRRGQFSIGDTDDDKMRVRCLSANRIVDRHLARSDPDVRNSSLKPFTEPTLRRP
jgi:hypothetical protein